MELSGLRPLSSATASTTALPPALTAKQAVAGDADLRDGIDALAGLVADSLGLRELLTEVASFAVRAIPGADGAGVTLLRVDRIDHVVEVLAASAAFVAQVDDIQYRVLREGPCITAALHRRTVRSGSLGGERTWPRFGPRVGRLGVHSVLSLPLLLGQNVVGAINVYAHDKDVFDERAAALGESFATPAAVAIHNAHTLSQTMTTVSQLQTALTSRPVIDQAIGLMRGRSGCSAEEAFARLRAISQNEHRKLADVAQRMIDGAVRNARTRKHSS